MARVQDVGARIEELLAALRADGESTGQAAEELVGLLVDLYGDGLARIMTIVRGHTTAGDQTTAGHRLSADDQTTAGHQTTAEPPDQDDLVLALTQDPLVESLLLLHDLHPLDVDARIQRALDQVRPYLGSHAGGVEYLGTSDGVARLLLQGSCHGCPSSAATVQLAIEDAIIGAAPEVVEVLVDGMTAAPAEPALLQIGRAPLTSSATAQADGTSAAHGWVALPAIGPPSARPVVASAAGVDVLICAVRGTLYAYRDACAKCGSSLAEGALDRERLTCPDCGSRFDVRLAGQEIDGHGLHLDPLPLLADSAGVRVALPAGARA